jgi:hypothetical protein
VHCPLSCGIEGKDISFEPEASFIKFSSGLNFNAPGYFEILEGTDKAISGDIKVSFKIGGAIDGEKQDFSFTLTIQSVEDEKKEE